MYKKNIWFRWCLRGKFAIGLTLIMMGLLPVLSLMAHTRVEVGPYAIVVGWQVEPPVIGERNAVTIEVSEDGQPVSGVESGLDLEFLYAGRAFRANVNPTETAGLYTAEIYPTVRGQYSVRLFGDIEGVEIDEVLDPEEVFSAARIQFPEAEPDPRELQQQIDVLSAELASARTTAYVSSGVAVLGLITAVLGLLRKGAGSGVKNHGER